MANSKGPQTRFISDSLYISLKAGRWTMLTRRTVLKNGLKAAAGLTMAAGVPCLADATPLLKLSLAKTDPVPVQDDFIGLGYEMSSVAPLGLLSPSNHIYVDLVKGLGKAGVLRVGGIVADYTRYEPNGTIAADRQNTVITRASVEQFAAFLNKIGWRAIWSVNFAQGTIDEAIEEARAVFEILGSRLLALEIGNEVDNYGRGKPFRSPPYDYDAYRKQYAEWHAAIANAVPGIHFAAPDTAGAVDWVERMAQDATGDVELLTTHYYRNGQNRGSAEQLLRPDPRLEDILVRMRTASKQSGIPWRMCETNSFSGGGRPGVSDTFVGALWTLDFMLLLAEYGCSGVNMETGVNQLGFVSSYSPIQDDGKGTNWAGVPYYGMLAFAAACAGCHQLLPLEADLESESVTAYVLGSGGKPRSVVIVNRDRIQDARVSVVDLGMRDVSILRLLAPSAESTTAVTLAGAGVDESGRWKPKSKDKLRDGAVTVPRMSAAILRARAPAPI
jgi:hypothetical protein